MEIRDLLNIIFKDNNVQYELREFEGFINRIEDILKIREESTTKKIFLETLAPFSSDKEEVQIYSENGKNAPEEIVRQLWVYKLINEYGYRKEEILLEKSVHFGTEVQAKAADIVVHTEAGSDTAKIIVETKKPNSKEGIEQLKSYLNSQGGIGVWSNGSETVILYRETSTSPYETLSRLPRRDQSIEDLRQEILTINDLDRNFNFKKTIEELEELVLADSGADEFNEIFKLIFAKIWDEKQSQDNTGRELQFRQLLTPRETYTRINQLFNDSKEEWHGVFEESEGLELREDHLHICIAPIERKKLLGSNLRIIDDAFEYLLPAEAKKKKGQFFTPRYVIDMCVRMLNPKRTEYVIDPACGSAGFLLHAMEWCYPAETQEELDLRKWTYAQKYLWGIDFETRAVKASKSLMLIAGDGQTNIHGPDVSGIDPTTWLTTESGMDLINSLRKKPKLLKNKPPRGHTLQNESEAWEYFKELNFDIVLSNPPFAGEIKDKKTLSHYELAKPALNRAKNKQAKEERDVLFIERIINMLAPGGRSAIVLPQGKFNNASLAFIRNYIMKKARILAIIGLHQNSFKPHTGVKTSVLLIQKYTDFEIKEINLIKKEIKESCPDFENEIHTLIESVSGEEIEENEIPELMIGYKNEIFSEVEIEELSESELQRYSELDKRVSELNGNLTGKFKDYDINVTKVLNLKIKEVREAKKIYPKAKKDRNSEQEEEFVNLELKRKSLQEKINKRKENDKTYKELLKDLEIISSEYDTLDYKINVKTNLGQLKLIAKNNSLIEGLEEEYIISETASKLDYPIFMAISNKGGKNNSGDYVYLDSGDTDFNGDLLVDQDLVNYKLTRNELSNIEDIEDNDCCIAEKFIKFAKMQEFDFWI